MARSYCASALILVLIGRKFVVRGAYISILAYGGKISREVSVRDVLSGIDLFDRDVATKVIYDVPLDPTDIEDLIHGNLFSREFEPALEHCFKLDPWLSAHLADIMEALNFLVPGIDESVDQLSLRCSLVLPVLISPNATIMC